MKFISLLHLVGCSYYSAMWTDRQTGRYSQSVFAFMRKRLIKWTRCSQYVALALSSGPSSCVETSSTRSRRSLVILSRPRYVSITHVISSIDSGGRDEPLLHAETESTIRDTDSTRDLYPMQVSPWPDCDLLIAEVSAALFITWPDIRIHTIIVTCRVDATAAYVKRYLIKVKGISPHNRPRMPRGGVNVYLYSFFNFVARWVWVVNATPRSLYSREWPGTHCAGGWVGPRAGVDGCGKSRRHRDSIHGPSIP